MSRSPTSCIACFALASALLAAVLLPAPARAQGVNVILNPAYQKIAPGGTFEVDVYVPQAGSAFNAYDAVVGWNPAAVKFVGLVPRSQQEGSLMTGACGNTFAVFNAYTDSATISHSLLCNNTSLTGPGQLYRLVFQGLGVSQHTSIQFRRAAFYNAGLRVTPVTVAGADVQIGDVVGVADGQLRAPHVWAGPNPARGEVRVRAQAPAGEAATLAVRDVTGRLVRRLFTGADLSGERALTWDGNDAAGRRVPSGTYWIVLDAAGRTARARVTQVR